MENRLPTLALNQLTSPRAYQQAVIRHTLNRLTTDKFHAYFIDMGLGKTLMSLYVFSELLRDNMADFLVVIAPKTLLPNWEDETLKHLLDVEVLRWQASPGVSYKANLKAFGSRPGRLFVCNIEAFQVHNETLVNFLSKLFKDRRVMVVLDESSKIKSPRAKRSKRLVKLVQAAAYRLIMTGTEVTNSILDIYTQFLFLDRGFWQRWGLYRFTVFKARYAVLGTSYAPGGKSFQVVVGYQRADELKSRIEPFVTRLKKADVVDLPEKMYQTLHGEMGPVQRRLYDDLKRQMWAEYQGTELTVTTKVALFTRFRQLTGGFLADPNGPNVLIEDNVKLQTLLDDMETYDGQVLIWACFSDEVELLHGALGKAGYLVQTLYGKQDLESRELAIRLFKDGHSKVLVANPAVAAYGLNLQFVELVYWYSNPLSAEQRWQGEDRCHRLGMKGSVLYKDLIYKDSIDEHVQQLLADKTSMREEFRTMSTAKFFEVF